MPQAHLPATLWHTITVLLATLSLSACAPSYRDAISSHREASACCRSLADIAYQPLRVGQSTTHPINASSPLFEFSGGRSFFGAFALPVFTGQYHLVVSSHALDDGAGPQQMYLFRPVAVTLDENFQVVRRLEADAFRVEKAGFSETAKLSMSASQIRVIGRLGFTQANAQERYLIVLTEQEVLDELTQYIGTDSYGFSYTIDVHNAPTGIVRVSALTTPELFRGAAQRAADRYESAVPGQRYSGIWFDVAPPDDRDYLFVDKSTSEQDRTLADLNFVCLRGEKFANAFVQSYFLGRFFEDLDADGTLAVALDAAVREHREKLHDARYENSTLTLAGAQCRRIDVSGRLKSMLSLPISGYDILCIHPAWAGKAHPLVVRIGANHLRSAESDPLDLPPELDTFYRNVRFLYPQ